jgi:hypothetical protein
MRLRRQLINYTDAMDSFATPRLRVCVLVVALAAGCASSTAVNPPAAEIKIEQMPASEFVVKQQGAVSIAYQMTVRNRSAAPIKLRKLEMRTIGRSPYSLRDTPVTFDQTVEAGKEAVVTFEMWVDSQGGLSKPSEKVFVSGIAYFETANGPFQTSFTQSFSQPKKSD